MLFIRILLDVFLEILVAESQKESRLPSLLSYSVVKEPASPKGRLDCQTPSPVSSRMVPISVKPFRLTRTHVDQRTADVKKSAGTVLQGPVILGAVRALVNRARKEP
jgi:hypothetical protein